MSILARLAGRFLLVIAAFTPVRAGSMAIAWDPVTDADLVGYRVFYGSSSSQYAQQQDVGVTTALTLTGLQDCATHYVAVKARDAAGNLSAAYSSEIAGWPRPAITQILPAAAEPGLPVTITITGTNFGPNATLQLATGIAVSSATVVSCTQITATITVGATVAIGPTTVDVTNTDGVFGASSGLFTVQASTPPSVISVVPASLATGIPVGVQPTVTFSEPMRAATITSTNIRLLDASGNPVALAPGSPSLSADGRVATLAPASSLDHNRSYRIQVAGGSTGVRDLADTAMASTYTQGTGFTTVPDTAGPAISAVAASNVSATAATVTWTTGEPADSQVFYRKTGEVSYQQSPLDPALTTSHSVRIQGLAPSTGYAFYVQSVDAAANRSSSTPDGTFTTGASSFAYLSIEAESGTMTAPVRTTSGPGAFRGAWIETPSGTPTGSASAPAGRAELSFRIPADGIWYVWVRLFGSTTTSDAWLESVDGSARQQLVPAVTGAWRWTPGRAYTLTQGLHSLELGGREAQARADRVLITNDAAFVPTEQPGDDVTPPAAPIGLAATVADRAVSLAWTNPAADVASIVVRYRSDGRFPANPVDGSPGTARSAESGVADSHTQSGLVNGTVYSFSVFTVDAAGNASAPAQLQTTPVDNLPPPRVGSAWRTDKR